MFKLKEIIFFASEDLPRYDKAVAHVWRNDRGYLFNAIRAKLSAYRKKDETVYNKDLSGSGNEGLIVVQDGDERKVKLRVFQFLYFGKKDVCVSSSLYC